jgi:hypothetical protein
MDDITEELKVKNLLLSSEKATEKPAEQPSQDSSSKQPPALSQENHFSSNTTFEDEDVYMGDNEADLRKWRSTSAVSCLHGGVLC